jgi:hypothetical protein
VTKHSYDSDQGDENYDQDDHAPTRHVADINTVAGIVESQERQI